MLEKQAKKKSSINNLIKDLEKTELIEVIIELTKIDRKNEKFLKLFILGSKENNHLNILTEAKVKLRKVFFGKSSLQNDRINLKNGRDIISEYSKILKGFSESIIELKLYYVELGVEVLGDWGDMYEAFYASMESMLVNVCNDIFKKPDIYPNYSKRLNMLIEKTKDVGWGFHDFVCDTVCNLENRIGINDNEGDD